MHPIQLHNYRNIDLSLHSYDYITTCFYCHVIEYNPLFVQYSCVNAIVYPFFGIVIKKFMQITSHIFHMDSFTKTILDIKFLLMYFHHKTWTMHWTSQMYMIFSLQNQDFCTQREFKWNKQEIILPSSWYGKHPQ